MREGRFPKKRRATLSVVKALESHTAVGSRNRNPGHPIRPPRRTRIARGINVIAGRRRDVAEASPHILSCARSVTIDAVAATEGSSALIAGRRLGGHSGWMAFPVASHPRDLTDEQWVLVGPFLPELARRTDGRGRPWRENRAVLNGILWILRTGAPWADLPDRYPSYQTCHRRFQQWVQSRVV